MENQSQYAPDTVQRLYELIKGQFGDTYTVLPAFPLTPLTKEEMPCIIIDRKTDGAALGPTSTDEVTEVIDVWSVFSLADSVGGESPKTDAKRNLELFVQGQDPTTQDWRSDTLYHLLRHYLTLLQTNNGSIWLIDSQVQTSYDINSLHDGTTNVALAQTRLQTQHRVVVQGRT